MHLKEQDRYGGAMQLKEPDGYGGGGTHLKEPDGHKGHIVGAQHGAEQHILHPPVEVHLKVLNLLADQVRGKAAGVCGRGLHPVQLARVLLPGVFQDAQIVSPPNTGARRQRAAPASAHVAAQPEEGDVHAEAAEKRVSQGPQQPNPKSSFAHSHSTGLHLHFRVQCRTSHLHRGAAVSLKL